MLYFYKKAPGDLWYSWNNVRTWIFLTSVILTISMKASSGSGQESFSHSWQIGWIHDTRSTAEELCFIGVAPVCKGWSCKRKKQLVLKELQKKFSVKLQKTYLVYLHGPLHPLLGCTKFLVQPVRQSLPEVLLKVCQLKNSSEITNTLRFYRPLTDLILSGTDIIYIKWSVSLLTSSVRKPCLSGYSEGSGKQETGCWPASVPYDP